MKKIFEVLVKPSRLILLIASIAYVVFYLITSFGSMGGGFLEVIANLIILILTVSAVAAIPVLLFMKKEQAAKIVFILVAGFWLISRNQNYLGYASIIDGKAEGLFNALGVFGFLFGLTLAAVLVLLVLHFILKKEIFRLCALFTFALGFLFFLVFFVLSIIIYAKYDYGWTSYINLLANLIAPVGILFGYLYFLGAPDYEFPKKAPKEEKPVEQQEEVQQEEPAQEEAPAEEKPE